jgi:SAM-dependent methyltransferase
MEIETLPFGAHHELSFWRQFVQTDHFKNEWAADKICSELTNDQPEVVGAIKQVLATNPDAKFLDIGSGVISILQGLVPTNNLVVTDLLGDEYAKFYSYEGQTRPLSIGIEDLSFDNQFDVAHVRNAIDHCQDPKRGFENMVRSVRKGGLVIVHGFANEAIHENWKGFHQWNMTCNKLGLFITGKKGNIVLNTTAYENLELKLSLKKTLSTGKEWIIWMGRKLY